ncbi:MAG: hypothetical protein R3F49_07925 [Planctomycetota bacterium]
MHPRNLPLPVDPAALASVGIPASRRITAQRSIAATSARAAAVFVASLGAASAQVGTNYCVAAPTGAPRVDLGPVGPRSCT